MGSEMCIRDSDSSTPSSSLSNLFTKSSSDPLGPAYLALCIPGLPLRCATNSPESSDKDGSPEIRLNSFAFNEAFSLSEDPFSSTSISIFSNNGLVTWTCDSFKSARSSTSFPALLVAIRSLSCWLSTVHLQN